MPPSRRAASLTDLLDGFADEILATVISPEQATSGEVPLWEPLPPEFGRGIRLPDGRVLSPQQLAYESLADVLFFGGSGGGGKTDLLLGLAFTRHRASIVFRREFTQFKGAKGMIERSREIVGLRGRLSEGRVWRDLPGGRALEFGAVATDAEKTKYQGRPHDLKAFDEIPEFAEAVFRFLIGWLRTDVQGQRTRVVCTGNPPTTQEGQWVIRYWAPWLDPSHPHPAKDGELRWYVSIGGKDLEVPGPAWPKPGEHPDRVWDPGGPGQPGQWVMPQSRTFIRSLVEDNPYYMRTGYAEVLNSLPEPLRSQLRFGNFQATVEDDPWQLCPTQWVVEAQARWREDGWRGLSLNQVGNDPSRGGSAEFAIAKRYGNWIAPLVVHAATAAPDGPAGARLVWGAIGGDQTVPVQVDIIGSAGSSVYDHLLGLKVKALAFNGSEKSHGTDKSGKLKFVNQRAELHWRLRELLDPASGQELALPPDPQLRSDLCSMRWTPTPRGIQIEAKEDISARIGRSPDRGEAVIYACSVPARVVKGNYKTVTWGR